MNKIVYVIGFFVNLLLLSCSNNVSPTETSVITQGKYSGTFFTTFKNRELTQDGKIVFTFSDSCCYSYIAMPQTGSPLKDHGTYINNNKNINMFDVSNFMMSPYWRNSLYLNGEFQIRKNGNKYIITQDNDFAKREIIISKE